jgi:uncharacterized protein YyaL (SSP411 family)
MADWLNRQFMPDGINAIVSVDQLQALQMYPYFKGRKSDGGETAFVCRNFTCSLPLKSQKELEEHLTPS